MPSAFLSLVCSLSLPCSRSRSRSHSHFCLSTASHAYIEHFGVGIYYPRCFLVYDLYCIHSTLECCCNMNYGATIGAFELNQAKNPPNVKISKHNSALFPYFLHFDAIHRRFWIAEYVCVCVCSRKKQIVPMKIVR